MCRSPLENSTQGEGEGSGPQDPPASNHETGHQAVGIEIASLLHKDLHRNDLVPLPHFEILLNVVKSEVRDASADN